MTDEKKRTIDRIINDVESNKVVGLKGSPKISLYRDGREGMFCITEESGDEKGYGGLIDYRNAIERYLDKGYYLQD